MYRTPQITPIRSLPADQTSLIGVPLTSAPDANASSISGARFQVSHLRRRILDLWRRSGCASYGMFTPAVPGGLAPTYGDIPLLYEPRDRLQRAQRVSLRESRLSSTALQAPQVSSGRDFSSASFFRTSVGNLLASIDQGALVGDFFVTSGAQCSGRLST